MDGEVAAYFPLSRVRGEGQGEGRELARTFASAAAPHPDLLVAPEARFQRDKHGEKVKRRPRLLPSAPVVRVHRDVAVGQVAGPDRGFAGADAQVHLDDDLEVLHVRGDGLLDIGG